MLWKNGHEFTKKYSFKEKLRRSGKRFGSQINRLSGRSGSRGDEREEHEVDGRERKRDQEKDKEVSRTKTKPKTANGVKRVQLTDVELKNSKVSKVLLVQKPTHLKTNDFYNSLWLSGSFSFSQISLILQKMDLFLQTRY